MFNGIIFNTGRVQVIKKKKNSIYVGIQTKINFSNKDLGTSVCCDGVCLTLIRINKKSLDRIESAGTKFQTKVRESYLKIANLFPDRIHIINGSDTIQIIHESIWNILVNYVNETS